MRVRIGNYYHRIAEVDLQITRRPVDNAMGVAVAVEHTWTLQGKLYNLTGNPATMQATLAAFEAAYSRNGQDIALEYADGRTAYHELRSRDCIGGTIVSEQPSFPSGRKGENNTFRSYRVVVKGVVPTGRSQYMSFTERITVKGGGAKWACMEVNEGPGIRQRLRTHSTCYATQSGSAVGYLAFPSPPPPIWPFALTDELPEVSLDSPQTYGSGFDAAQINHGISWSYNFEATGRLFGIPHYLLG